MSAHEAAVLTARDKALDDALRFLRAVLASPDEGTAYTRVNIDALRNVVRSLERARGVRHE